MVYLMSLVFTEEIKAHLEVEVSVAVVQQVVWRLTETADGADELWCVHGNGVFNIYSLNFELQRRQRTHGLKHWYVDWDLCSLTEDEKKNKWI